MSKVVELLPNNGLCVDQATLAQRLHTLADRIASGELGGIDTVCVILSAPVASFHQVYGRNLCNAELLGILEFTKARVMGAIE